MLKISDRKLQAFKVGKLFEIEKCKCSNASELKQGNIPYVGATNKNNGTMSFCGNIEKVTKGNCIVFVCDGQGSVGYSFYKSESFVGSTTLKVGRNKFINKYNALFITTALDKNRIIYSFGYKRNEERLKNETVFLPVDKKGNPDYDFMEQFIKERELKKRNVYIEYAKKKLNEINSTNSENLWTKYKAIKLKDIFNIYTGRDLILSKIKKGNIPIISHTALNNGISNWTCLIENRKLFNHKRTISLADRGNFKAFVQKQDFYIGTRVKALEAKDNISYYLLLYLALLIDKQAVKFSYGHNACDNTDNIVIEVPVKNNKIDYDYMDNYIKDKMIKKYQDYISTI